MSVASGTTLFPGLEAKAAGKVCLLNFEDDSFDIQQRGNAIIRCFKDLDPSFKNLDLNPCEENLHVASMLGQPLSLLDSCGEINEKDVLWLKEQCKDMRLVVLDPLSHLHTADENSASQMSKLMQVLKGIGQETGAGIIIAHHTGKGNLQQYARGSSALVDACRVVMTLHGTRPTRGDSFTLELTWAKLNDAAPITPVRLRRTSSGVLVKADEIPY